MFHQSITDYLQKSTMSDQHNDSVGFYFNSNLVLQNSLKLFFATHKTYIPQPKNLSMTIKILDPTYLELLNQFIHSKALADLQKIAGYDIISP